MRKIKIVIFGYGARGKIYADYARAYPEQYEVTAIVEINEGRRKAAEKLFDCPVYADYKQMLLDKPQADIIAVATQDEQHEQHATACMEAGYDLLLEKPIADTKEGCLRIYEAAKKYERKVIVCHVLRYSPFYSAVKRISDSGKLGEIITIHASENVGYYHQAHSYVRGPWRNKEKASPMILAKCCHDMDIIRYMIGEKCVSVNSYGSLSYFKEENAPESSAAYCSDCKYEDCVYKAQTIYTSEKGNFFASYFTTKERTEENILRDLKGSQYDRCVFKCDNDVVDHEVTIMQFENGKTACHTMTAFSQEIYRDLKIHGTKAELVGVMENNEVEIRYFTGETEKIAIDISAATVGGHMGGDAFMMNSLYKALNGEKAEGISYLDVSIESHLMSFGAEESRLNGGKTVGVL